MRRTAFDLRYEDLPGTLPILPLAGMLLLPRGRLPVIVSEPRYLALTRDALAAPGRVIGLVQPRRRGSDAPGRSETVYPIGCAGRITGFRETDDGHYDVTLTGLCRFDIVEELPSTGGYRRVAPDWSRFRGDFVEHETTGTDRRGLDRPRLLTALKAFFEVHGLSADWATIDSAPDEKLVTSLAMSCPFEPTEKQALLETEGLVRRAEVMTALFEMAVLDPTGKGEIVRH